MELIAKMYICISRPLIRVCRLATKKLVQHTVVTQANCQNSMTPRMPAAAAGIDSNVYAAYWISVGTGVMNPLAISALKPNVRRLA